MNALQRNSYLLFTLCAGEGIAAVLWLMLIPADPKNQLFLGYSASRLLLMVVVLLLSAVFAGLASTACRCRARGLPWPDVQQHPRLFNGLIAAAFVLAVTSWGILFVLAYYPEGGLLAYYTRFAPLLFWTLLTGLQGALWFAVLRFGFHWRAAVLNKPLWRAALVMAAVFLAAALFIIFTGTGITPDAVAWGEPGVALLEWQLWAGLAAAMLVFLLVDVQEKAHSARKQLIIDVVLVLAIWGAGTAAWISQPIPHSYFTLTPRPPNFEFYPYSDAANHDLGAQYLLIGQGFMDGKIIKRPLLSLFFALLHLLGGQSYQNIIDLQTPVLALFPVLLFLLGKILHSRAAGMAAAFWAITREINSIAATAYSRVSDSKLLLSDLPSAVGVSLFCLLAAVWLKSPGKRRLVPLLCGGALGLLMLVRTQTILFIVFVLPAAFWVHRRRWRPWLRDALVFSLGLLLAILPWIGRNAYFSGRIAFDQTEQTGIIAQRYTDLPGYAMPPRLPGESEEAYTQRFLSDVLNYTLTHPGVVASFVAAHFLNNEMVTALVIPLRGNIDDLADAFSITRPFWGEWGRGYSLSPASAFLLAANLLLIALGIASAWRRWKLAGLTPFAVNIIYNLSNALVRNSGGRYVLPADWAGYFYYGMGLLEIASAALVLFGFTLPPATASQSPNPLPRPAWIPDLRKTIGASLLIVLAGLSLPIAENVFPVRYPRQEKQASIEKILAQEALKQSGISQTALAKYLNQPQVVVAEGRALYPVYLAANDGVPGFGWWLYSERAYPRLAFLVIGRSPQSAVLPLSQVPASFPNASDVIIAGIPNPQDETLETDIAILPGSGVVYLKPGFDPPY